VSPDSCTCCAVATEAVFCTSAAVRYRNWLVVVYCDLIFGNSTSAASVSATSWSICACICAVGGRGGAGVDLRVAGFLPLLGPAGLDVVTVIARVVRGSSLEELL